MIELFSFSFVCFASAGDTILYSGVGYRFG